jgi:hypothetical protein
LALLCAVLRAFAGAVEDDTACVPWPLATLGRATTGVAAGTRGAEVLALDFGAPADCVLGAAVARRLGVTAPLVVADTARVVAFTGLGAGAAAAVEGSTAAGGVGAGVTAAGACAVGAALGAAVGAPGVPKPGGVQAQASAAPVTPILSTDNVAKQKTRTRFCTRIPLSSTTS